MGLFDKREPCIFCGGKVKGLLPWKLEGHPVCNDCHGDVDVQPDHNPETVDKFRKYMSFRAENRKLAQDFQTDYRFSAGFLQDDPVFDLKNHRLCFTKHLNKTIFCAGEVREFTIAEDQNIIFRGNAKNLEQFESIIPQRVQEMLPLIDRVALEIQQYERMEEMRRAQEREAREANMELPPRPYIRRPEVPRPFEKFVITMYFDHPYWTEKTLTVKAPDFSYNRPNAYDYMERYRCDYDSILELANAIAHTLFPDAQLRNGEAQDTPAASNDDTVEQLRQYKKLMDEGVISQDEFDAKKKQLMGI